MTKTVQSPVKRWPGNIVLHDPLTFPQLLAFEQARMAAHQVVTRQGTQLEYDAAFLPGLLACVAEWHLRDFPVRANGAEPLPVTVDTFPTTPRQSSNRLIVALARAIGEIVDEGDEDPPA